MVDARQNLSVEAENGINRQINNELKASYHYLAMSAFFASTDVAMPGATAFFHNQSLEEREHAQKLINYLNDRGGHVQFFEIEAPKISCTNLVTAFQYAVALEKWNNEELLKLHRIASEKEDPDLTNFLEEFYLREQVIEIQQMTRRFNQVNRAGPGLGEHLMDQELLKEMCKTTKQEVSNKDD